MCFAIVLLSKDDSQAHVRFGSCSECSCACNTYKGMRRFHIGVFFSIDFQDRSGAMLVCNFQMQSQILKARLSKWLSGQKSLPIPATSVEIQAGGWQALPESTG